LPAISSQVGRSDDLEERCYLSTRYLDYLNGLPIGHTLLLWNTSITPVSLLYPSDILTWVCGSHIMICISDRESTAPSSLRITTHHHLYDPPTSSPTSSSSSVFSIDAPSSQSSVPSSSTDSLNAIWEDESDASYFSRRPNHQVIPTSADEAVINPKYPTKRAGPCLQPPRQLDEAVALESRQHPRRTQYLTKIASQNGGSAASCPRPPPSLVRQCERKDNFVDSLVGKLTWLLHFEMTIYLRFIM